MESSLTWRADAVYRYRIFPEASSYFSLVSQIILPVFPGRIPLGGKTPIRRSGFPSLLLHQKPAGRIHRFPPTSVALLNCICLFLFSKSELLSVMPPATADFGPDPAREAHSHGFNSPETEGSVSEVSQDRDIYRRSHVVSIGPLPSLASIVSSFTAPSCIICDNFPCFSYGP